MLKSSETTFSTHRDEHTYLLFANFYLQSMKQVIYRLHFIGPIRLIVEGVELLVTMR